MAASNLSVENELKLLESIELLVGEISNERQQLCSTGQSEIPRSLQAKQIRLNNLLQQMQQNLHKSKIGYLPIPQSQLPVQATPEATYNDLKDKYVLTPISSLIKQSDLPTYSLNTYNVAFKDDDTECEMPKAVSTIDQLVNEGNVNHGSVLPTLSQLSPQDLSIAVSMPLPDSTTTPLEVLHQALTAEIQDASDKKNTMLRKDQFDLDMRWQRQVSAIGR